MTNNKFKNKKKCMTNNPMSNNYIYDKSNYFRPVYIIYNKRNYYFFNLFITYDKKLCQAA